MQKLRGSTKRLTSVACVNTFVAYASTRIQQLIYDPRRAKREPEATNAKNLAKSFLSVEGLRLALCFAFSCGIHVQPISSFLYLRPFDFLDAMCGELCGAI